MAFLDKSDYSVLIRNEILEVLEESEGYDIGEDTKLIKAENMAIAQLKNYLKSHYDLGKVFVNYNEANDTRNAHIVMITIDCALYHLYSSVAPNLMPENRANRYQDALDWLKDIRRGNTTADLPLLTDDNGEERFDFRISSAYKNENNRW
jgi:phage gp36-like protein